MIVYELGNKSNAYNIRNLLGNFSQNIDMIMKSAYHINVFLYSLDLVFKF